MDSLILRPITVIFLLFSVLPAVLSTAAVATGWNEIPTCSSGDIVNIYFTDAYNGFALDTDGFLFISRDGGFTWSRGNITYGGGTAVAVLPDGTGWIVGENFSKTVDGGRSWRLMKTISGYYPYSIQLYNDTVGWALGLATIYKMTDGENWTMSFLPYLDQAFGFTFVDTEVGFVSGNGPSGGYVLKTVDGGNNWSIVFSTFGLYECIFPDRNTGYVGGVDNDTVTGRVWKTTDGGRTWTSVLSGDNAFYHHIFFADPLTGWVYDNNNNKLYYTQDGGATWVEEEFPGIIIFDIYAVNATHAWLGGEGGKIAVTTDGGLGTAEEDTGETSGGGSDDGSSATATISGYDAVIILFAGALAVALTGLRVIADRKRHP